MQTQEKTVEESVEELSAEFRELLLARKVWTHAIDRLEREKIQLLQAVDVSKPQASSGVWLRLKQIEHETAMYEICLDRVHERAQQCEGVEKEDITQKRERFYRLMRGLAKAGNERAEMRNWDPRIGCVEGGEGWSPDRWVSEMETVASEARKLLVAAIVS